MFNFYCLQQRKSNFQIKQCQRKKIWGRDGGGAEVPGDVALLLQQVHAQQQGRRGALGHLHRLLCHHHHSRLHAGGLVFKISHSSRCIQYVP